MTKNAAPPRIIIFGDFTEEELKAAHLQGEAAAVEFNESFQKITEICREFDQVELIARLAMVAIAEQSKFGEPNFNPSLQAFELEIFQAVALSTQPTPLSDQRQIAWAVRDLLGLLRSNSDAFKEKSKLKLTSDAQKNRVEAVLDRIRVTTQTVRGARHAYQTRAYLRDLAEKLDNHFQTTLGFSVTDIIDLFEGTAFKIDRDLEEKRGKCRRWMGSNDPGQCLKIYLADNPESKNHPYIAEISFGHPPIEQVKVTLFAVFEQSLQSVFRLQIATGQGGANLWNSLGRIALGFGGIGKDEVEHLHLTNPVITKPLVATADGQYYLFCAQSAFSNLIEIVEVFAEGHPKLIKAVGDFKAAWLETKLAAIVGKAFPSGAVHSNAEWVDSDGKQGETDCLLVIDKTVGLFEAKSGKVTAAARRGGTDGLKQQFKKLLVKPSRQSARFQSLLQQHTGPVAFTTPKGTGEIEGDSVREVIRVNILFDTIGPLSANARRLVEAGFIDATEPMAPCMSIFELETLLDVLPNQISRLHYLRRRGDLERNTLFEADEMDLIALYLESSFCIDDLEFNSNEFSVYGWSDRIARLYDHDGRRIGPIMKLKRTAMWERLLAAIEEHGEPGWSRFGYRLCNVRYPDQWAFQRLKGTAFKKARKVKKGQAVHTGAFLEDTKQSTAIGICVGNDLSEFGVYSHSETAARSIMDFAHVRDALVIYWDVVEPELPYKFVATFLKP